MLFLTLINHPKNYLKNNPNAHQKTNPAQKTQKNRHRAFLSDGGDLWFDGLFPARKSAKLDGLCRSFFGSRNGGCLGRLVCRYGFVPPSAWDSDSAYQSD